MINKEHYVKVCGVKCVSYNQIKDAHPSEYNTFKEWHTGQTGLHSGDKLYVYAHDYERWLEEGKKPEQLSLNWD